MKNKVRIFKPFRRLLHINNEVWTYEITRKSVCICSPDLKSRAFIRYSEVTNMSNYDVERGQWKRWLHITPSVVKQYIVDNFAAWKDTPISKIINDLRKQERENWDRMQNSRELIKQINLYEINLKNEETDV